MIDTAQTQTIETSSRTDEAALDARAVGRALAGDSDAVAEIYDRHADGIHTMCVHMLGEADEAADVCAQVFLVALQRLHQLREPEKLRSWLYAITRNEVYRRTRDRARTRPVEEPADMAALAADPSQLEVRGPEATADVTAPDPAALAELVQVAAGGLEDRDRMVLELNVVQGLDGQELADALGVRLDNAYQMTHRMRERFERSVAALLVVSAGREHCSGLDGVARRWDGNYDVLWRKRFARHVERCDRCQRMKSRLPKAVLAGAALSQAAQAAVLAAPISVREQVLACGPALVATSRQRRWSRDGFPRRHHRTRRSAQLGAVIGAVVLVVLGVSAALDDGLRAPSDGNEPSTADSEAPDPPTTGTAPGSAGRPPGPRSPAGTAPLPLRDPDAGGPGAGQSGEPGPEPADGDSTVSSIPSVDDGAAPGTVEGDFVTPTDPITGPTPATPGGGSDPGVSGGSASQNPRTGPGQGPTDPRGGSSRQTMTTAAPGWQPSRPPVIRVPPTFRTPAMVPSGSIPALR